MPEELRGELRIIAAEWRKLAGRAKADEALKSVVGDADP
jgi:hypothetical protein